MKNVWAQSIRDSYHIRELTDIVGISGPHSRPHIGIGRHIVFVDFVVHTGGVCPGVPPSSTDGVAITLIFLDLWKPPICTGEARVQKPGISLAGIISDGWVRSLAVIIVDCAAVALRPTSSRYRGLEDKVRKGIGSAPAIKI